MPCVHLDHTQFNGTVVILILYIQYSTLIIVEDRAVVNAPYHRTDSARTAGYEHTITSTITGTLTPHNAKYRIIHNLQVYIYIYICAHGGGRPQEGKKVSADSQYVARLMLTTQSHTHSTRRGTDAPDGGRGANDDEINSTVVVP